jgi:sterol desaturase/sphingolipid hydroxylase (fatty acid hydroxylase superfamily)
VLRPGLGTDLVHAATANLLVAALGVVLVVALVPVWIGFRRLDLEGELPAAAAVASAVVIVAVGQYWGHRLMHTIPTLWRFHAVHHSIEQMDWVAAARLHPVDQALTQFVFVAPLFVLGYDAGVFGGAAVVLTFLAIFQHANVRMRFPGIRWIVPTPEWHHWHLDADARDTNFGLPVVDAVFGTAHLPRNRRPIGFGCADPVPGAGYVAQLAYPLRRGNQPVGA